MTPTQIAVLVIVLVVVVVLVAIAWATMRRRELRRRFGPEYDRLVAEHNDRGTAERELRDRERQHAALELRPLPPGSRDRYAQAWEEIQARFIESPQEAVRAGDELLTQLIGELGYPTGYDDQLAHLSVEHARTLQQYRDAHEISLRDQRGEATTEQLRQALVEYRALFAELLGDGALHLPTQTAAAGAPAQPDHQTDATNR